MKFVKFTEDVPAMGNEVFVASKDNDNIVLSRYIFFLPMQGEVKVMSISGSNINMLSPEEALELMNTSKWLKLEEGEENPFVDLI